MKKQKEVDPQLAAQQAKAKELRRNRLEYVEHQRRADVARLGNWRRSRREKGFREVHHLEHF